MELLNWRSSRSIKWLRDMPLPAGIFITLIILIGGYLFLDATRSVIFGGNFRWLYLAILTGLSSFLSIKMPVTRKSGELYAIAVGDIFVFTGLLLFGVPVAVLLSGVEGIVLSLKAGVRTTYRLLFNAAHLVIAGWVMGEIFYALHGQPAPLNPVADQNAAILMVEIGVGGLIYFVLDMGLLSIAMSMASRQPISSFTHGFEWAAISHFSCASLGALIFLFFGVGPSLLRGPGLPDDPPGLLHLPYSPGPGQPDRTTPEGGQSPPCRENRSRKSAPESLRLARRKSPAAHRRFA